MARRPFNYPRPSDARRVWVVGLPLEQPASAIIPALQAALGMTIAKLQLHRGPTQTNGTLLFPTAEGANQALATDEIEVLGHQVRLHPYRVYPNPPGSPVEPALRAQAVWVAGISGTHYTAPNARTTLVKLAERHGRVLRAFIFFEPDKPWQHRGEAVLTMGSLEQARAVLKAFDGRPLAGEPLVAEPYELRKRGPGEPVGVGVEELASCPVPSPSK
ncbi:MAG: hypothetical protein R3B72_49890 [Polyangiaceae bacterium]